MSMSVDQQKDILDHTYSLLTKFNNGVPPKGSVAPWWETSKEGTMLLLEKGIEYGTSSLDSLIRLRCDPLGTDHSNMAHEYATRRLVCFMGERLMCDQFPGVLPP